nr:hypothetical protein [uncultured Cupriavidus sp.]
MSAPEPEGDTDRDLFRRVGYYDFRAYTQLTSSGLNQGFVLARHHLLVGTVQTVFRAGKAHVSSAEALRMALEKLAHLANIASETGLPMDSLPLDSGEQSI